jgi:hypothetical protein
MHPSPDRTEIQCCRQRNHRRRHRNKQTYDRRRRRRRRRRRWLNFAEAIWGFRGWGRTPTKTYVYEGPKKETPAETKSDLEYLKELLATSNDLLDLISEFALGSSDFFSK